MPNPNKSDLMLYMAKGFSKAEVEIRIGQKVSSGKVQRKMEMASKKENREKSAHRECFLDTEGANEGVL